MVIDDSGDLIIRHRNGKIINVKPGPIGWTPPTKEEEKEVFEIVEELKRYGPWRYFVECSTCGYYRLTGLNHTGKSSDLFHTFGFDAICPDCGTELYNGYNCFSGGSARVFVGRYKLVKTGDFKLFSISTWPWNKRYKWELERKNDKPLTPKEA